MGEPAVDTARVHIPACPICKGRMHVVYDRYHQTVVVCVDCHSGLTITASAADVIKRKREGTWTPPEAHR